MAIDFLDQKNLRARVKIADIPRGLFNAGELEMGSETSEGVDPEDGAYIMGGRQTGTDVECTRPWKRSRDLVVFQHALQHRGRVVAELAFLEYDDYNQPVRPDAIAVFLGQLILVKMPHADAASDDAATLTLGIRVKP